MQPLELLASRWLSDAAVLEAALDERGASLFRLHASELQAAIRSAEDEELTLGDAAKVSGYSQRRLRELIAEGAIDNVGAKGRPRVRRGNLPRKPTKVAGGFDADAEARAVLGDGR